FHLHQIDCCGNKLAVGINHAQVTAFDTAETAWDTACPVSCTCPSSYIAEDGKTTATLSSIKVTCSSSGGGGMRCMTYIP
ncbi:MAG TPA: hypothetical protein VIF09_04790, partial [Polyangiaceae bacterium]